MAFRFLTAGESHGQALVAIVEGMAAGLPLSEKHIAGDLARRQRGYGRGARMQIETDQAEILSGVRHGLTLGGPIALLIHNKDWGNLSQGSGRPWAEIMSVSPVDTGVEPVTRIRPGHADLPGALKYGHGDVRNVLERASARETAARVAVGAVARRFLEEFGVEVRSHTVAIGAVKSEYNGVLDWAQVEASEVRCADAVSGRAMMAAIDEAKKNGDTLGGVFEVIVSGVPVGLGSHVHWDRRLGARIAGAVMSIHAVKGVEVGDGFNGSATPGSRFQDAILPGPNPMTWHRTTNRAGGIEGGMSDGEPIVVRAAVKPIATLARPLPSVDLRSGEAVQAHYERSDVCVVPAAGVVGEAMVAIVLAGAMLEKFGGDHIDETKRNHKAYLESMTLRRGDAIDR
ncbi:MAG: chorismate synthase [Chloroflexi bacterium]|nr:chorismate synthase [Chloroflexota bacterium]